MLTEEVLLVFVTEALAWKNRNPPLPLVWDISFIVEVTTFESSPVNSISMLRPRRKEVGYSGSLYCRSSLVRELKNSTSDSSRPGET